MRKEINNNRKRKTQTENKTKDHIRKRRLQALTLNWTRPIKKNQESGPHGSHYKGLGMTPMPSLMSHRKHPSRKKKNGFYLLTVKWGKEGNWGERGRQQCFLTHWSKMKNLIQFEVHSIQIQIISNSSIWPVG